MEQRSIVYAFGPFRLDLTERRLLRSGTPVPLQPKAFGLLQVLVERQGHLVHKDELMGILWPDTVVDDSNLTQNVYVLRKALGSDEFGRAYLETVPRCGYRFIAPVRRMESGDQVSVARPPSEAPQGFSVPLQSQPEPVITTAEPNAGRRASRRPWIMTALTTMAVATGLILLVTAGRPGSAAFESMEFTRITSTGNTMEATMSRDVEHVAYVEMADGSQRIRLRSADSTVTLVESVDAEFRGLRFSDDARYLYYVDAPHGGGTGTLRRIPIAGGTPEAIASDVYTAPARIAAPPAFSPEGRSIAFVRAGDGRRLMVTPASGDGGERELIRVEAPEQVSHVAWSPNGELIAYTALTEHRSGEFHLRVLNLTEAEWRTVPLTNEWLAPRGLAWHPSGRSLFLIARNRATRLDQILLVTLPRGHIQRVTNDINSYVGVTLASDARALLTMQREMRYSIWVGRPDGVMTPVTPDGRRRDRLRNIAWTPDSRLVYQMEVNGDSDLWLMDADGRNARQLTTGHGDEVMPVATPDGRYIVFASQRGGGEKFSLWRMNADGSNARRLVSAPGMWPEVAADGSSVFFSHGGILQEVSIEPGDAPTRVQTGGIYSRLSPTGGLVATIRPLDGTERPRIAITPVGGERVLREIELPMSTLSLRLEPAVRWMSDGRSLAYVDTRSGVSNIWRAPIDGGPHEQITAFDRDFIHEFDVSRRDGRLAAVRIAFLYDAVLIRGF